MSRTDKTAPMGVKALYYPHWVEECHDHTKGYCDLPARPTPHNVWEWERIGSSRSCFWDFSTAFWRSGMARCGCAYCDGEVFESPRRRRVRYEGRRYCRGGWEREY